MTSVERVMTYTKLDSEPGYQVDTLPSEHWPCEGNITFRDVSMMYYQGRRGRGGGEEGEEGERRRGGGAGGAGGGGGEEGKGRRGRGGGIVNSRCYVRPLHYTRTRAPNVCLLGSP